MIEVTFISVVVAFAMGFFARMAYLSYMKWSRKHPGPEVPLSDRARFVPEPPTPELRSKPKDFPEFPEMPDFPEWPKEGEFAEWPNKEFASAVTKLQGEIATLRKQVKDLADKDYRKGGQWFHRW